MNSLASSDRHIRFNIVAPGLVEGSPVHKRMLADVGSAYVKDKHASKMQDERLVDAASVVAAIMMTIENMSIASAVINVDRGMVI